MSPLRLRWQFVVIPAPPHVQELGPCRAYSARPEGRSVGFGFRTEERAFDRAAAHHAGEHIRDVLRGNTQRLTDDPGCIEILRAGLFGVQRAGLPGCSDRLIQRADLLAVGDGDRDAFEPSGRAERERQVRLRIIEPPDIRTPG